MSQTKSYIAKYRSTDPKRFMLGGVKQSQSSRFESRKDAELRLQSVIDIHAELDTPLVVTGEVIEVSGKPEIFDDGSVLGCKWGKAGRVGVTA